MHDYSEYVFLLLHLVYYKLNYILTKRVLKSCKPDQETLEEESVREKERKRKKVEGSLARFGEVVCTQIFQHPIIYNQYKIIYGVDK